MKLQINKIVLFIISVLMFLSINSCRKEPKPETGFSKPFYISMEVQGKEYKLEEDTSIIISNFGGQSEYGFSNYFRSSEYEIYWRITFKGNTIDRRIIKDLEGKNLPISPRGGYPWVQVLISDYSAKKSYSTGLEMIDYGSSDFKIEEVITGPKVRTNELYSSSEKKHRTFILRGTFTFNFSTSWTKGITPVLYPATKGKFSVRIFEP